MTEFYENSQSPERAVLISVDTGEYNTELSLYELEELAKTAGAEVFCTLEQNRERPDNATYLGSGRLKELTELCEANDIDLIIADSELTPAQQRGLEAATKLRVIDRTTLILDIFALNARSGEGKLQVELAQLKYLLPRLSGRGASLSRLGGGIGTRGPGESKLESDRRHIRRRIHSLEEALRALEMRRARHRSRRKKDGVTTVAIVGYTNAGKSTLLNSLTEAGVLAENKLFATLDPTSRALKLPDGRQVLLIDTVGFISRLPHKLIEAFKSTLEELKDADLLLNVCDASAADYIEQERVTKDILKELEADSIPIITVYNKCDIADDLYSLPDNNHTVKISALKGIGIDTLLDKTAKALPPTRKRFLLLLPFTQGSLAAEIRRVGAVHHEEYQADGLFMDAVLDINYLDRIKEFIVNPEESEELK